MIRMDYFALTDIGIGITGALASVRTDNYHLIYLSTMSILAGVIKLGLNQGSDKKYSNNEFLEYKINELENVKN